MGRARTRTLGWLLTAALTVGVCLYASSVRCEAVRYHGFQLDETYRLVLAEEDGWVRVGLLMRIRPVGGNPLPDTRYEEEGQGEGGRYMDADFLLRVRSEVVVPAAPNYFQNPGQRYRIMVEGLSVEPDYAAMVETDASHARDVLVQEMEKFRMRVSGVNDKAIWSAEVLVLEVLKEADRMPAYIAESVKRSKSGAFRIVQGSQERRSIAPGQTWAPKTSMNRPVAGATLRERQRGQLPKGAVSWREVRAPSATPVTVGPQTPAAAGVQQGGATTEAPRVEQSITSGAAHSQGATMAPGDARYTDLQTQSKTWELMGAETPSQGDSNPK